MNWTDIIEGAGQFFKGYSFGSIIGNWLERSDSNAFNDIEEFVKRAPDTMIDEMDTHLLRLSVTHLDFESRTRLVKFYAFFKLVEYLRYQQWRGFPTI